MRLRPPNRQEIPPNVYVMTGQPRDATAWTGRGASTTRPAGRNYFFFAFASDSFFLAFILLTDLRCFFATTFDFLFI